MSHVDMEDTETIKFVSVGSPNLNTTTNRKYDESIDSWRINLGVAPAQGLLVWTELEKDVDFSKSRNLNAKYLMEFNGGALNLQGGVGDNSFAFLSTFGAFDTSGAKLSFAGHEYGDSKSMYMLADYYFDNTLSFGVGVSNYAGDYSVIDSSYLIRGQKFFTDSFSIRAEYLQTHIDDTYSVGASLRF